MERVVTTPKTQTCPTCRKVATRDNNKFYPCCSERCQLVDLGRWLNEEYRVPGEPVDPADLDREPEGGEK